MGHGWDSKFDLIRLRENVGQAARGTFLVAPVGTRSVLNIFRYSPSKRPNGSSERNVARTPATVNLFVTPHLGQNMQCHLLLSTSSIQCCIPYKVLVPEVFRALRCRISNVHKRDFGGCDLHTSRVQKDEYHIGRKVNRHDAQHVTSVGLRFVESSSSVVLYAGSKAIVQSDLRTLKSRFVSTGRRSHKRTRLSD